MYSKVYFSGCNRRWLGGVVVGRRTCDREVAGSTPAAALFEQQPWASCSHLIIIIINGIYIALSSQVAMQLGNDAANALKQLRGIKHMSFHSVSKNSH